MVMSSRMPSVDPMSALRAEEGRARCTSALRTCLATVDVLQQRIDSKCLVPLHAPAPTDPGQGGLAHPAPLVRRDRAPMGRQTQYPYVRLPCLERPGSAPPRRRRLECRRDRQKAQRTHKRELVIQLPNLGEAFTHHSDRLVRFARRSARIARTYSAKRRIPRTDVTEQRCGLVEQALSLIVVARRQCYPCKAAQRMPRAPVARQYPEPFDAAPEMIAGRQRNCRRSVRRSRAYNQPAPQPPRLRRRGLAPERQQASCVRARHSPRAWRISPDAVSALNSATGETDGRARIFSRPRWP